MGDGSLVKLVLKCANLTLEYKSDQAFTRLTSLKRRTSEDLGEFRECQLDINQAAPQQRRQW